MVNRQLIFESYERKGDTGLEKIKFCPVCGEKLVIKKDGLRIRPTCPECGFVHYRNPYPGVVVIIENNDHILLGKRAAGSFQVGKWCLPGGFIEFEEDYILSAIREVKEETNLDVDISSIMSVSSNFLSPDLHTLVVTLVAKVIQGTPLPGDDIEELGWFHIEEQLPDMAFEADTYIIANYRHLISDAIVLSNE